MTHYRISLITKCKTLISEYWDDLEVRTYTVNRPYTGGDILNFIELHDHFCNVNFENLQFYLERVGAFSKGGI